MINKVTSLSSALASAALLGIASLADAQPRAAVAVEAAAASPAERARALRDEGNQAMLDMRYVDALALYREAHGLAPTELGVLYSMARAHQLLGDLPEALDELEEFDRLASPEMKAKVGGLDQLFFDLRSHISTLELRCSQPGARVLVRDRVVGTTPLRSLRLAAGAAPLQVELDGFFTVHRQVVLPAGGALQIEVALHARSTSSLLSVGTQPGGARVSVDGKLVGTANPRTELILPPGAHRIGAAREGYETASVPVVLAAGATRDLVIPLEKAVPITSRWWFWAGAAAFVAGGAALTAALLIESPAGHGSLPPGQVSAPLQLKF